MNECKACEGTGTVRAVNPRTGERDEGMSKETCPMCFGGPPEPAAEAAPAEPEPDEGEEEEEAEAEAEPEPDDE